MATERPAQAWRLVAKADLASPAKLTALIARVLRERRRDAR